MLGLEKTYHVDKKHIFILFVVIVKQLMFVYCTLFYSHDHSEVKIFSPPGGVKIEKIMSEIKISFAKEIFRVLR